MSVQIIDALQTLNLAVRLGLELGLLAALGAWAQPSPRPHHVPRGTPMNASTSAPAVPALVARALRAGTTVTPAGRWTSVAGAAYVAGWVAGIPIAPSGPGTEA